MKWINRKIFCEEKQTGHIQEAHSEAISDTTSGTINTHRSPVV